MLESIGRSISLQSGSVDTNGFGIWISLAEATTGVISHVNFPVQSSSGHLRLVGH